MLSYTGSRNLYASLTNNTETSNLTLGDTLINQSIRSITRAHDWPFLYKSKTATTTASTQFYQLPNDVDLVLSATIAIGTFVYPVKQARNRQHWDLLNQSTYSSTYPEWFYVFGTQIGFWPIPSASSNTITYYYKKRIRDLSIADYTTGSVLSIASAATTVTGNAPSWTASMAGRYINITESNTANKGDGQWYEIASVTSSTVLELTSPYQGTSISAGTAAYTIGQMSVLPEDFHELPVYRAAEIYYTSVQPNTERAALYKAMYEEGYAQMEEMKSDTDTNPVIEETNQPIQNPNLYITAS